MCMALEDVCGRSMDGEALKARRSFRSSSVQEVKKV